jgi:hypothetical protein
MCPGITPVPPEKEDVRKRGRTPMDEVARKKIPRDEGFDEGKC